MMSEEELVFTGERFHPEVTGAIEIEHLHRYAYALPYAQGKAVLDIACGEGYGSAMLARVSASVIGVDIAQNAISHARQKYVFDNLDFRQGSCTSIPVSDKSIDLVVSFETIEHLAQHEEMLLEIKRCLKPEGILLISSPDKEIYSDNENYQNPFHFKELYKTEFEALLHRHFQNNVLLGQKIFVGSVILREVGASEVETRAFEMPTSSSRTEFRYNIMLASDGFLPDVLSSFLDCSSNYELDVYKKDSLLGQATHLKDEVELLKARVDHFKEEAALQKKQLEARLSQALQQIRQLHVDIKGKQKEYKALERSISERDKAIDHLLKVHSIFSWTKEAQTSKARARSDKSPPDLTNDLEAIRHSAFFNKGYYLATNPDLHPATDAAWHYFHFGSEERRDPGPFFSTSLYLSKNPDVAAAGCNALLHYERQGIMEGRDPPRRTLPSAAFLPVSTSTETQVRFRFFRRKTTSPPPWVYPDYEAREAPSETSLSTAVAGHDYIPCYEGPGVTADAAKVICFYLPQFHPIPENDKWWGKDFTEWTNVRTGTPQFEGHYQPHVPGELGYYNLLDLSVPRRQVELAKLYGVGGFCFYFYWFSSRRLLETPIQNYVADKSLDLPFCLCWANENWTRRWDGLDADVLMAQQHSEEDDLAFIEYVSQYMRDPRYIRIDGKPLLVVYRPSLLPSAKMTTARWRTWCLENGIGDIYLAYTQSFERVDPVEYGLNAAIEFPPNGPGTSNVTADFDLLRPEAKHNLYDLHDLAEASEDYAPVTYTLFRSACPSWDNTARRKAGASIFVRNSPPAYQRWLGNAIADVRKYNSAEEHLVFINAWNEWSEGAHLEPDGRYGYAYLEATRVALTIARLKAKKMEQRFETAKMAVIIHAFYMDVFCEIIETLGGPDTRIKIFVTTIPEYEAEIKETLKKAPFDSEIHVYENHGRDILPFLSLLRKLDLSAFAFVLKLHTKKSLHRSDGEHWRQQAVACLARSDQREWILRQMFDSAEIGMVGPRDHVVPMHFYHGSNIDNIKWIAARLGFETISLEREAFIAGTMFIARTEALIPILNIALGPTDFEPEAAQLDGTMAHAIERALTFSAAAVGLGIASIGPGDAAKRIPLSIGINEKFAFAERS